MDAGHLPGPWCVSGMRGRGAPGGRLIWRKIIWNTVTFTQIQIFQKVEYNTGPCWGRFLGMHFLNWHIVDFNYSHWKSSISHWKDWCWSWNSNTLATWCEELTHLKRPWCWERLRAGGEGDDRGWGGWMASPNQQTWVWVNSRSWWWTGRPGVLQTMESQRIRHDWATELNW